MNAPAELHGGDVVNGYTRHPLSAVFPDMPADELVALKESIVDVGLREAITIYEGMVLDGWHRNRACAMADVAPLTKQFVEHDPVEFVLRKNSLRRSLTAGQKAMIAVNLANWREPGRPEEENSAMIAELNHDAETAKEIANKAGVSTRTVEMAKAAAKGGLAEKVVSGELSLAKAVKATKPERADSKQKPPTKLEREQQAHAATRKERDDLRERLDELVIDLEAYDVSELADEEQANEFKKLHRQIETYKAQLVQQQEKSVGLLSRAKAAEKRLRRYEP